MGDTVVKTMDQKARRGEHRASDRACPIGSKHRILGHTQFSVVNTFALKVKSKKK